MTSVNIHTIPKYLSLVVSALMRGSLQNTEIQHSSPFLCKYFYKIDIKHLMCSTITTTLTLISDMNDNEFPSKLVNLRQLLAAKAVDVDSLAR